MTLSSNEKSVCVFDFDGTLVDSMGGFADLAAELCSEHYGLPKAQARLNYLSTSGLPFFQQLEVLWPGDRRNSRVSDLFEARKKQDYFSSPYFSEVPEAIDRLRKKGIKTVISSNNGQGVVEEYLQDKPRPRFDLVLGLKANFEKGRDHFQKIIEHYSVEPQQLLFIGDSLHDAHKALEFGVDFVARLGTFSRVEFETVAPSVRTVNNFDELTRMLCR